MKIYNSVTLVILALFSIIPSVLAQLDTFSDAFLRIFIGKLPSVCTSDIGSTDCIYCLGFVKVLPLLFFFAITYLLLAFVILGSTRIRTERGPQSPTELAQVPTYHRITLLISILIAILILNLPPLDTGIPEFISRIRNFQNFLFYIFGFVASITIIWFISELNPYIRLAIIIGILGLLVGPGGFFSSVQETFTRPITPTDNICFIG